MSEKPKTSVTDVDNLPAALERARRDASMANTTVVTNTKLAACLAALGFPPKCMPVEHVQKGGTTVEFTFELPSTRAEFQRLRHTIANAHESGQLQALEPMHPLCVMMRAQQNYDALLKMQQGEAWRLVACAGSRMTRYVPGVEAPGMLQRGVAEWTEDLSLAAAVSVLGIPVISILGSAGQRKYGLPVAGYVLKNEDGSQVEHATANLIRRSPTAQDPHRLAIEDENPLHPVALAYDALHARAEMKRRLRHMRPLLLHEDGGLRALVTSNHTGRVMDQLARRFGAPPV